MATSASKQRQQPRGGQSRHEEERGQGSQRMSSGGQQSGEQQQGMSRQQQSGGQQQQGGMQRSPGSQGMMGGQSTSPFSFLRRFGEGMEQLFNDFGGGGLMQHGLGGFGGNWMPQIEVFQREDELVIRADLPGMNKNDVRVEVRDDAIVLQGERHDERHEERHGRYTTERSYGRFYREIPLPEGVDAEEAQATFRDGVLEITMPSEQNEARGRQLEIQEGEPNEQQHQQQGRAQSRAAGAGR